MAEIQTCVSANIDRQGHLLAAHSGGHRVRPAQSHGALTMLEETMSGTWRWRKLKSWPATGSRPRTTTSTPNIISGRCPRTESDIGLHIRTRAKERNFSRADSYPADPQWGQRASLIVATRDYIDQRFALRRFLDFLGEASREATVF